MRSIPTSLLGAVHNTVLFCILFLTGYGAKRTLTLTAGQPATTRNFEVNMSESFAITVDEMVDSLTLRNRAYQVIYALADHRNDPEFYPRTLTDSESLAIVGIVQDVQSGRRVTPLDVILAERLSPGVQEYVAGVPHVKVVR